MLPKYMSMRISLSYFFISLFQEIRLFNFLYNRKFKIFAIGTLMFCYFLRRKFNKCYKMALPSELQEVFSHIDGKKEVYIQDLKEYVAIPSFSVQQERWPQVTEVLNKYNARLLSLGAQTEVININKGRGEGESLKNMPPVVMGSLGEDPAKKTILIYLSLDVHLTTNRRWNTDPCHLVERDGKLFGRGVSTSKGPALCWLHVFETYSELKRSLPVNVKFIIEGFSEYNCKYLVELCLSRISFFAQVDSVCTSCNNWLEDKPCIVYGQRGLCCFEVALRGMNEDMHSGEYGGVICEPMSDLVLLMTSLQDRHGKIILPGFMMDVVEPSLEEFESYQDLTWDLDKVKTFTGVSKLDHDENRGRLLLHRWRMPVLSIHGVEGLDTSLGEKTVIPARVVGKFSIRIVENQEPEKIGQCVTTFLENLWREYKCTNALDIEMTLGAHPLVEDPLCPAIQVAQKAMQHTYKTKGELIRNGGTIPIAYTLRSLTGKSLVMLCVGAGDDGVQGPNEKIEIQNYMDGHKLFAAYMYEVAQAENL